jgi:hypothetical protein
MGAGHLWQGTLGADPPDPDRFAILAPGPEAAEPVAEAPGFSDHP